MTATHVAPFRLDRHLRPDAIRTALEADVRTGLTATPKTLPPKWFYDARGSMLFDEITRLEEYYPTRREKEVLEAAVYAADLRQTDSWTAGGAAFVILRAGHRA